LLHDKPATEKQMALVKSLVKKLNVRSHPV
jgi:hypothetical protein